MKRIGRFLVAGVLAVGLAGCSSGSSLDPVGQWAMVVDWACDSTFDGSSVFHFYPNGTFIDSLGNTGTWTLADGDVTINATFGSIYGGTAVDSTTLEGNYTLTDGTGGCWSATKLSDTP